jgi:hypothetical protein
MTRPEDELPIPWGTAKLIATVFICFGALWLFVGSLGQVVPLGSVTGTSLMLFSALVLFALVWFYIHPVTPKSWISRYVKCNIRGRAVAIYLRDGEVATHFGFTGRPGKRYARRAQPILADSGTPVFIIPFRRSERSVVGWVEDGTPASPEVIIRHDWSVHCYDPYPLFGSSKTCMLSVTDYRGQTMVLEAGLALRKLGPFIKTGQPFSAALDWEPPASSLRLVRKTANVE